MKKCPTCEKTYEDSMRFCQTDGTALVDDEPAFDPFATIIAPRPMPKVEKAEEPAAEPSAPEPEPPPAEPSASEPESLPAEPSAPEPESLPAEPFKPQPEEAPPIEEPADLLDLPDADPLKTMYVSEAELKSAMATEEDVPVITSEVIEIPPIETDVEPPAEEEPAPQPPAEEAPRPEPPPFIAPEPPAPNFGDIAPPPSPFSKGPSSPDESRIPTPSFDEPPAPPSWQAPPAPPEFNEAATMIQPPAGKPLDPPASSSAEPWTPPTAPPVSSPIEPWTPPVAPDQNWQNQPAASDVPFQSTGIAGGSVNQTLPIVSLVFGILSICCYISPVTGAVALITGYLGMKNANNDPANYGGKGLAIGGMIVGGLFFMVGLAYYIVVILVYAGVLAGSILQGR